MSVPIATSPGRAGFGPQLGLFCESGAGNDSASLGWLLGLQQARRKTDKGPPRFDAANECDVFILSGAEHLVSVLVEQGDKSVRQFEDRPIDGVTNHVCPYRPRIERLFARIECWTNVAAGVGHWRSISKPRIKTWWGKTTGNRSPSDRHVFRSSRLHIAAPETCFQCWPVRPV